MPKNTKTEKVTVEATSVPAVVENKKTTKASQKGSSVQQVVEVVAPVVPVKETKTTKSAKTSKVAEVVEVKVEQPVTATETTSQTQEGGKRRVRYFRCIYSDDTFGRFSGYKPKQAAGKALTSILRQREKEGQDLSQEVSFSMIECTRGGNHKVSQYNGKRVKLEKPVTVSIKTADGKKKEINYNFTNKINKIKAEKKTAKKAVTKKTTKKAVTKKATTKKTVAKKSTKAKKVTAKKATTKKADA